ncbi:hypothetical protein PDIG_22390 [Penicillium digitatum PHI26]|uniref:CMP/dCMP-type deaminase domain-containing protein n=2 Tax=Penicillium digitatum TaxID=36651 RepID=K9G3H8_PEND2|nr:hypothetical protein PDIP_14780 [Penicillium digitatum Pd1]EKV15884.1 hypothetical protein PDIG_22390 [Penicillium digitatum PHI26]EKV20606.1 hypothetical protein PDIP_14780 [Penicillium digitatum Pd1]
MEFKGDSVVAEDSRHGHFMKQALLMGEKALESGETPVGCVLVHDDQIVGSGMNDTNRSMNVDMLQSYPRAALQSTDLYVTVEPCVMCASALKQYRIRKTPSTDRTRLIEFSSSIDLSYPVYGGLFREEAIMLLRRFYIQENEKAPNPRPKKNRELNTRFEDGNEAPSTW